MCGTALNLDLSWIEDDSLDRCFVSKPVFADVSLPAMTKTIETRCGRLCTCMIDQIAQLGMSGAPFHDTAKKKTRSNRGSNKQKAYVLRFHCPQQGK